MKNRKSGKSLLAVFLVLVTSMALILLSIIPVIVFCLTCQKHIIKGVAAGAVKG